MIPLGEETAVQAIVGSIVWAFRRLKKTKESEDERLHSVCPKLSFFLLRHLFECLISRAGNSFGHGN